ncbi:MAG: ABC transporter permease [Pseudomonadota bacterium]
MSTVPLEWPALAMAAVLIFILGLFSLPLGVTRSLYWSALRMAVQLLLVGMVLKWLFESYSLISVALISLVMLAAAGYEVLQRQRRRFRGVWGYSIGLMAMLIAAFSVTILALNAMFQLPVWYEPRYSVTILGMVLGNTMTGVGVSLEQLTREAWSQRGAIEAKLAQGYSASEAIFDLRRSCVWTGMIPTINALAAAGLISLPGMMTGQILAGTDPLEAVKYQFLIMCLIAAGAGFGTLVAVWIGSRRLFDERQRLRLDYLTVSRRRGS